MTMRVVPTSMFVTFQDGLNTALASMQTYQTQLATGRRINAYSDDPAGAVQVAQTASEQADWTSYQRAAQDAQGWLGLADTTLQNISTLMQRIKTLALQAADGALSQDSRSAIAKELTSLRDQLDSLSNTKHLGRSIFGGFSNAAVTFSDATGAWSYVGDQGKVMRRVGPSATVQANVDGKALFGFDQGAAQDLFSTLDKTIQDVSGPTVDMAALTADQAALDAHTGRIQSTLGEVGAWENRVDTSLSLGTSTMTTLTTQRSAVEDTDVAAAVLHLQQAQNAYQATLGAVAQANLPSLASFLK